MALLLSHKIKQDLGLDHISSRTVRRRLAESWEFENGRAETTPFISEIKSKYRCYKHRDWTKEQLRKVVLWSDESPFELRRFRVVCRRKTEKYHPKNCKGTVKHNKKIKVWSYFAAHGRVGNLFRVNGILDQHGYHSSILQWQMMKPSVIRLFPTRTANFSRTMIPNIQSNQSAITWPIAKFQPFLGPLKAQPIENLWSILDMKKVKDRAPKNENQLFEVLQVA